ncbi:hypothetical protein [Marinicella meishanensis]|nr:hypothetical protein [Marinicella sp. NBU2979]
MNDKNVKPHNSVADSLEAFRPFPVHAKRKPVVKNKWLERLKQLLHTKH